MKKFAYYKKQLQLSDEIIAMAILAEAQAQAHFADIDDIMAINQAKVLSAFWAEGITESHLWGSTGYGYNDMGRESLDRIYARVFNTPSGHVRSQFVSGTHAIASCLFALLASGDELLFASGKPYDTLHKVVGWTGSGHKGNLLSKGIKVKVVELTDTDELDEDSIFAALNRKTKMVYFQKSRGYQWRKALSSNAITQIIKKIGAVYPKIICFVDNCYGEFVEVEEPITQGGTHLMAGSLIKNPGGGLALSGGYVVGDSELIDTVADYTTAPTLGRDMGATWGSQRMLYQGLFLAPHMVGQALKTALFTAALCGQLGLKTSPGVTEHRSDIVQAIKFDHREQLIRFCQGIQQAAPIDSMAIPEPGLLPGYQNEVIMAAGTFVQGASLELTADAPIKAPYVCYVQGGLTYEHGQISVLRACDLLLQL